jgi:hypothetical protein
VIAVMINDRTFEHGYEVVPHIDGAFFAKLTHAQFHEENGNCSKYKNREVWNDKCTCNLHPHKL